MSIFSYFFKKPIDKSKLEKSRLKDYDKAINFYEETLKNNKDLKIDPYHIKSYNNRGTIKYDMGLFEDAIKDYDRAIELDNNYFEAYCNRANAKYSLGLYKEALKDYKKALELDTTNTTVIENIKNIENKYSLK
ncbi:tetratricopeptide repeat protein [Brachyspira intermedia]|uniref:tetratricopeptide repeat protein n=1 Tax=Brachyspira intermedia TaxID=84377 RepID=UPI00261EB89B|nr:tetratricopeptide repeat protein [uncultured Brachyspira sp.]